MDRFFAYLIFTAILVATPGSTTAVVVRNALVGGYRAGLAAAFGAALGNITHASVTGVGLAAVLARQPRLLDAVRVAGALYLAWLGVSSLYRAWRYADGGIAIGDEAPVPVDHRSSVREGLLANLLNPTIITFYLVVVPTFIPSEARAGYYALLAASHVGMAFVCHSAWATALDRVRRWLGSPFARRALEALTGALLVLLAAQVMRQ
jgi:threonine/homoserine/homoserine lactone efflux protein